MCEWSSLCSWLWLVALEDSQVLTGDKGKREISKDISNFWQPFQTKYQNKNTFWQQATGGGGPFNFCSFFSLLTTAILFLLRSKFRSLLSLKFTFWQKSICFCHRGKQDKGGWFSVNSSGIGCTFGNFAAEGRYQMCFSYSGWPAPGIVLMDNSPVLSVILIQSANQSDFDLCLILKFDLKNL